jgi:23S rRNA pseudouridine1911/1915/1917 synthase
MFEKRDIAKFYWAVVAEAPSPESGVINRPIAEYKGEKGKDPRTKKLARISSAGKPSVTAYRVLSSSRNGALLECRAVTGRLHQVRVHLASIGHPILGDAMYAPSALKVAASRLALHAHRIAFTHPTTGEKVDVKTSWPTDLRSLLKRLGLARPDLPAPKSSASGAVKGGHEVEDDDVGDEES